MSTPPPEMSERDRIFTFFSESDEDDVPLFYEQEGVEPGSDEERAFYAGRWAEFGLDPEFEVTWIGAVESPETPLPDPEPSSSTYTPSIAEGDGDTNGADEDFRRVMDFYRSMDNDVPNPIPAPAGPNTGSYDDMRRAVNGALADANDVCAVPVEPSGLASRARVGKGAISYDPDELAALEGAHIVAAIERDWEDREQASPDGEDGEQEPENGKIELDRMQLPEGAEDVAPEPVVMTTEDRSPLIGHVARIRQVESLPGYRVEESLRPVLGLGTPHDEFASVEDFAGAIAGLNPYRSLLNRIENARYGNHLRNAELSRIIRVSSALNRFVRSASADMRRARAPFSAAALEPLEELRMFDAMTRLAAFDPRYTPDLYEMSPEGAAMVLARARSTTSSRTVELSEPADGR